jgi:hypothetical protein
MSAVAYSSLVYGIEVHFHTKDATRDVMRYDPITGAPTQKRFNTNDIRLTAGTGEIVLPDDSEFYEDQYPLWDSQAAWLADRARMRIAEFFRSRGFVLASEKRPDDRLCAVRAYDRWVLGRLLAEGHDDGYRNDDRIVQTADTPTPYLVSVTALGISAKLGFRHDEITETMSRLYLITRLSAWEIVVNDP